MSMFDQLICEYPLPGWPESWGEQAKTAWQFKDFAWPQMDWLTITKDGLLKGRTWQTIIGPREARRDWIQNGVEYTPETLTGQIVFYGRAPQDYPDPSWLGYKADFVKGKLVSIVKIETED
jgi:hypothetical protein